MNKKKNKNTENVATGLSAAVGSLIGSVSANAAVNKIKSVEQQTDEIDANNIENSDEIEVISYSNDNNILANVIEHPSPTYITATDSIQTESPEPIIVDPEPDTIVDIVYAGPTPEPYPIDPSIEPILCVYGPPEPDIFNDIDDSADDILEGV